MRYNKHGPGHQCLSCGDDLSYLSTGVYVGPENTDKPGYRCGECAAELLHGVTLNNNINIVGAPETKKVDDLVKVFGE